MPADAPAADQALGLTRRRPSRQPAADQAPRRAENAAALVTTGDPAAQGVVDRLHGLPVIAA